MAGNRRPGWSPDHSGVDTNPVVNGSDLMLMLTKELIQAKSHLRKLHGGFVVAKRAET
jgi:hypothetical protein